MDVTDENSIDTAKKQAQGLVDGIDLLFNNAGVNFGEENMYPFSWVRTEIDKCQRV
jgi:NADP-dependent 3-hydroxy acid dehydrogenase YdfG